jgi:ribose/xylose/arabinose/galactoside ABC-type transport system permease subunit/ABC-type branched-subunit amino acid transport system ATPase component
MTVAPATAEAAPARPAPGPVLRRFIPPGESNRRWGLIFVSVALALLVGQLYDNFLAVDNGKSIALNVSALLIATIGATALLVAGYVDLSIGSQYGLISVLVAFTARDTGSTALALLVGVLAGLLLGAFNGLLVLRLPVSPIIATLATLLIFRGVAYALSNAEGIFGFSDSFTAIGQGRIATIPVPVIVAVVLFALGGLVLTRTVVGLRVYAIGGNAQAARLRGVRVSRYTVGLYAVSGMTIGIVAILTTSRLGSGNANIGNQFELDVLTAVILGGVAFNGGAGRLTGVLAGVATIGILNASLVFAGLEAWYQDIAKGGVLLLALVADQWSSFRTSRSRGGGTPGPASPGSPGRVEPLDRGTYRPRRAEPERREVLRAEGLQLSYGSVRALRDGSLTLHAGEVVCLVGDNGAGKSSLIKILSGAARPAAGTVTVAGETCSFDDPAEARRAGIETVYQDLALCQNLGVAHNLVLGAEPRRRRLGLLPLRDDLTAQRVSTDRLASLGVTIDDLARPVQRLSGGQRQSVAIARVLGTQVKVVILDEPTAALGVKQTRNVLAAVRAAAEQGAAVLLITHDVETVFAIADRIVVLRLGEVVHDGPADGLDDIALVHLMAGLSAEPAGGSAATRAGASG